MAIFLIVISLATQSYRYLLAQQTLLASGERLYQFLRFANTQAVKFNQKVYVHFCQAGSLHQWDMAMSEQASCDCFNLNSCLFKGEKKIESLTDGQYVITSADVISFTSLQASYSPMRFATNAGSITLTDKTQQQIKVIQSHMRLKICTPNKASFGYAQC